MLTYKKADGQRGSIIDEDDDAVTVVASSTSCLLTLCVCASSVQQHCFVYM